LLQEVAYHRDIIFHWPLDDILSMEARREAIWLREIARINREINEARRRGSWFPDRGPARLALAIDEGPLP